MKKFISMLLFFFVATFALLAQTEIPVPTDTMDVLTRLSFWVAAFPPLVGLTIFLTALLLKIFKVTGSGLKQFISWITGAVLVVVLNLVNMGIAKDLMWYGVAAYAVAVALGANRYFDVGLLEGILKSFNLYKPKPPTQ